MNQLSTPIHGGLESIYPLDSPFRTPTKPQIQRVPFSPSTIQNNSSAASANAIETPKGKWFNPEAQRVLNDRASHMSERQSTIRLRWNIASMFVVIWWFKTGVYRQIKDFGLAAGVPSFIWSSVEWLGLALLAYNVGEAAWCLLQPKDQYTGAAMTPSQRLRVGLDSVTQLTGSSTPISAPKMTPSKSPAGSRYSNVGSITNLETRRMTPTKSGLSSIATPASFGSDALDGGVSVRSPRILRTPAPLSTNIGNMSYSTDSDLLTLTQVLKKRPGESDLTNDNGFARPATDGNFSLRLPYTGTNSIGLNESRLTGTVAPRLPFGRYGVNDMATATTTLQQPQLNIQPSMSQYQTATPMRRLVGGEGSKGLNKERSAGDVVYLEPHQVLEKYGVERDILDWVENMHTWFVEHLLKPLCKQIDDLDALFEQHGLGHLSCRRAVLDTVALEQAKARTAAGATGLGGFGGGMFGGGISQPQSTTPPQTLIELSIHHANLAQTKERMALEDYLLLPGYSSCRDYIVQRIHTLSQSSALPAYTFDGGGNYMPGDTKDLLTSEEKPWNPVLHPTDAQLLFYLFCTFMDKTMPPVQNLSQPFADKYVLQPSDKPDSNLPVQIIQVVRKRPHFCLNVKGSYYDVAANRNNLFITLILFVLEVQRECAGYLGLTNLGGKHVDLLAVIGK